MEPWFTKKLINWYKLNKRHLPWRNERDPYKIWISEIILQQTQVKQGLDYYLRFINKYPTVIKLAKAPEDEVLKLWQGLGYYSRARNLHASAKFITKVHKGVFPQNYEDIRALKGVGDYTAAAIASFGFNLPHAVVDGNVYRLLSRLFGINAPIDSPAGKRQFFDLANQLLDKKNAGLNNQAIMEFGSQFCKVLRPNCEQCVFNKKCFAFKNKLVDQLPFKAKKTMVRNRYFNYLLIIDCKGEVLITKRSGNDIWKGLYEFFLLETNEEADFPALLKAKNVNKLLGNNFGIIHVSKLYKHVLSHQHLYTKFYVIRIPNKHGVNTKVNVSDIKRLAVPRVIDKFLHDCDLKKIL